MVSLPPRIVTSGGWLPVESTSMTWLARRLPSPPRTAVMERADAGPGPDDVVLEDRPPEILADRRDEIGDLGAVGRRLGGVAVIVLLGGADQREIVLVGDDEDVASVGVAEHVAAVVLVELRDDDVAALDETDRRAGVGVDDVVEHGRHPWRRRR